MGKPRARRPRQDVVLERILIPVDGSRAARAAARLGVRLARSQGGRVHACYVVDRSEMQAAASVPLLAEEVRTEVETQGRRALRQVGALCAKLGVPYTETLAEGPVAEQIVAAARQFRAHVIVMGTQGFGRVKAFLLGSTAQDMLSRAPCPVLVVRQPPAPHRRTPPQPPAPAPREG